MSRRTYNIYNEVGDVTPYGEAPNTNPSLGKNMGKTNPPGKKKKIGWKKAAHTYKQTSARKKSGSYV